jgi:TolB protein
MVRAAAVLLAVSLPACGGETRLGLASQLFVVDVTSGERRQLTNDERSRSSPTWSPDGRHLALLSAGSEGGAIEIVSVVDGEKRVVLRGRGFIEGLDWSPSGNALAFVRSPEPTRWTLETVQADGSGHRLLARHRSVRVLPPDPAWSPDGDRIAYAAGADVFNVPRNGARPRRIAARSWAPRWSPDGDFVLVVREHGLFITPREGRPLRIAGRLIDAHPAWSPLGHEIAFSGVTAAGDRRYHLYLVSAQGGRLRRIAGDVVSTTPAWSPDGRLLAFATWDGSVRVMNLAHGQARRLTHLRDAEIRDLVWSPDGRRLAFVAREVPEED